MGEIPASESLLPSSPFLPIYGVVNLVLTDKKQIHNQFYCDDYCKKSFKMNYLKLLYHFLLPEYNYLLIEIFHVTISMKIFQNHTTILSVTISKFMIDLKF